MILNLVFHGAWVFVISEKNKRIFAYTPDESNDHHVYGVGSLISNTRTPLDKIDYEFQGVVPYQGDIWYPNNVYSPLVSAKNQGLKQMDPGKKRYCYISLPFPQPVDIFPLEPYDTVSFLSGSAMSDLSKLIQFPSCHAFVYEFSDLKDLQFESADGRVVTPSIPPNPAPYQQTANLHVFATYEGEDNDGKEMEKCFNDITYLFDPKIDLTLTVENDSPDAFAYAIPPGLTKDEVELPKNASKRWPSYGTTHNCQNTDFFVNETDGMQLP